jgi:hypothetical protein
MHRGVNMTKQITEIVKELRDQDFYKRQPQQFTSDPDELVDVALELYPTEIVRAAQAELGQKALSDYFVEIYEFAKQSKEHNSRVKKSQLSGVLLTHNKINKWLAMKGINDVLDLYNPDVLKIYLQYHSETMKKSAAVFETISKNL